MAKESLQRAAIAWTAAGKRSKNVRRHSLDRLHASMIKQKQKTDLPLSTREPALRPPPQKNNETTPGVMDTVRTMRPRKACEKTATRPRRA